MLTPFNLALVTLPLVLLGVVVIKLLLDEIHKADQIELPRLSSMGDHMTGLIDLSENITVSSDACRWIHQEEVK